VDERVEFVESPPSVSQPVRVRRRRGRLLWLLLIVALVIGIGYWLGHRGGGARPGRQAFEAPQPVGAAVIGTGDIRVMLNELGTVTPLDTVTVLPQVSGPLISVPFKEGQIVKKGDALAEIDPRPFQAALQQAEGQLAHDQGVLDQAKADLQRYTTLARQDSIAQQQVQDQRFLVEQDEGTVKADQGTVATDQLNLGYTHIVSPIDGMVGLRLADPGNYITSSSSTGIAVINQMQPMSVIFTVPQQNIDEIMARMQAGATMPVYAFDASNTKLIDTGTLSNIDNQVNTTTGTVRIRALFPNAKNQLFPQQFVNVRLLVDTLKNVVRVPVPAVQTGAPGTYVWVIKPDGTVAAQPVKLGPVDGDYQQVIEGLQPGEQVVTDGTDRLRDGTKVTIPPAAAPATGEPAQKQ